MSTINETLSPNSVLETAENRANMALEAGESCVRKHPESAVWTAFGSGLLLGGLLAWLVVEERQHHWRSHFIKMASRLGR